MLEEYESGPNRKIVDGILQFTDIEDLGISPEDLDPSGERVYLYAYQGKLYKIDSEKNEIDIEAGFKGGTIEEFNALITDGDISGVEAVGGMIYKGGYDASLPPNSLAATGYTYTVIVAGNAGGYFSNNLDVGDLIISEIDNPTSESDWTVVNKDVDHSGFVLTTDINTLAGLNSVIGDATIADQSYVDSQVNSHTHALSDITDSGTSASLNVAASGDAAAGEVVKGDDTRLSNSRTPTAHTHTLSDVTDSGTSASLNVAASGDAAVGEVVKGDDSRLTGPRTPTAHTHTLSDVTDAGTAAALNVPASGDATIGEVVKGNDSRLSAASAALQPEDIDSLAKLSAAANTTLIDTNDPRLTGYNDAAVDIHLNQAGPTDGYVLSWTGGDYAWVDPAAATDDQTATEVSYNNTSSGLVAGNVQAALDEIEARVDTNDGKVSNVTTNLGYVASPTNGVVTSSDGDNATLTLADATNAGLLSPTDFIKLSNVDSGATDDQTPAEILSALLTVDGSGSNLDADTLDGLDSTAFQLASEKGQANGYAELDNGGKVPASQLPSYVDDIVEYADLASLQTGDPQESGKIYVTLNDNKIYRYTGTPGSYVEVSPGAGAPVSSVNTQTGAVVLDADDLDEGVAHKFVTAGDLTNLGNLSGTNTGDQDLSTYQLKPAEGAFVDGDKTKLDGLVSNVTTDLAYTASPTNGIVTSSDGTDATLTLADGTNAGLMAPADFTKLGAISGTNTGDQDLTDYVTNPTASADSQVAVFTADGVVEGTANFTYDGSILDLKNGGTASSMKLYCEVGNAHFTELKSAPHANYTGGSKTFVLPAVDGSSGHVIQTDGAGNLSFVAPSGGGSGHTIEDEGIDLAQRGSLNFVGAGVTATDDAGNDRTIVTISGGGGGTVQGTDATYDIQAANEGATAGNARGENSVDLQTVRTVNTQVASGNYSTIGGGQSNTASGYRSTVGGGESNTADGSTSTIGGGRFNTANIYVSTVSGGYNNTAGGNSSTIGGGYDNTASGDISTIGGGYGNTASGGRSTIGGGIDNTADGEYSTINGGYLAKADKYCQQAYSSGGFNVGGELTLGTAQTSLMVVRNQTNDAIQTDLYLNGWSLPAERMTIADDTTWFFEINLVARRTDANDESAIYKFEGAIDRNTGAASTTLVGTVTKTVYSEDTPAWDATVEADTTNGALVIKVTGESPKVINWVARVETTEVTG